MDLEGEPELTSARNFADGLRQLVWLCAPDGRCRYVNAVWRNFTGLTLEQSSGNGWQLALHPADLERVTSRWRECSEGRLPFVVTYRLRSSSGEYRVFGGAAFPLHDRLGTLRGWTAVCTEADAAQRADDRFRTLANALPMLVWTTDREDRLTFVNRAWLDYTGLPAGSLIEERNALVHADDLERLMRALRGGASEVEFRLRRRRDGMYRWHLLRWERTQFGEDASFYRVGTAIDIEERRVAQLVRERQLYAIAEAVPDIVWSADASGAVDYANSALVRYVGRRAEDLSEHRWIAFVHADDRGAMFERWKHSMHTGDRFEQEFRLRRNDGAMRWFIARALPVRDAAGDVTRWFGSAADIDDRVRSTARLRESERHYRELAMENARLYEREHRVSEALQAASLPQTLPSVPWLSLDAVYLPGSAEAQIGGDWYDAFRLPDGRLVLSIGDVAGSGLDAAVTMSSMRQIIRGTAQVHADPVLMLNAADRALRLEDPDRFVTAFVGVLSPVTGTMTYASAGHVPPIVRRRNGSIEELRFYDLPLGLRERPSLDSAEIQLDCEDTVVLYTDGLVEADRSPERDTARLFALVADPEFARSERPARYLRARALPEGASDDVAIMTVKIGSDDVRERDLRRWHFEGLDAHALQGVRRAFRNALAERGAGSERLESAELVLGELAGNAVRHAPGPVRVLLDFSNRRPVLHVIDEGPGFERAPILPQDPMSESGRGLYIVSQLTAEFSVMRRRPRGSHARAVLL